MIASGANYKDVQLLMEHSDIGITLNTYVHPNGKTRDVTGYNPLC